LSETFDAARAVENLKRDPDVEIGVAPLDRTLLAGIGNDLKSEILFLARTDPRALIRELDDAGLREIARTSREVAQFSYENGGATISTDLQARVDEQGMSPRTVGRRHYVFRRTNKPCWNCGTPIRQFRQGEGRGRITYVCPNCQNVGEHALRTAK
jgi:endonuclease VIII